MKKVRIIFVAAILAALAAIPMFAAAAALTPEFDKSATEKLYEYMDFDKVKNEGEWKSPARIIDDGSGNMVYDVRDAYDYFGQNSLKNHRNYTIEYNAKITYNGDAPGIIFKEHTTNDQLRMQLILDAGNGKITLKELSNEVASAQVNLAADSGNWIYMKIESIGTVTNIYYNNKETPVITYETEEGYDERKPIFGCMRFIKGGATTYYVDNLLITKPKAEGAPSDGCIIPEPEDDAYVLLHQTFEDIDPVSIDPAELGWDFSIGSGGTKIAVDQQTCNQYLDLSTASSMAFSNRTNYKNFKMEFNMLLSGPSTSLAEVHFYRPSKTSVGYHVQFQTSATSDNRWGQKVLVNDATTYNTNKGLSFTDNDGKWVYVKIECIDGEVKVYYNNKETPEITYTYSNLRSEGMIGFINRTFDKMYIDNLLITTTQMPRQLDTSTAASFSCDGDAEEGYTLNYSHYIINLYPEDCNATFIVAAYEGDRIVALKAEEKTISGNNPDGKLEATEVKLALPLEQAAMQYDIKVYIWNNLQQMIPYSAAIPYQQ